MSCSIHKRVPPRVLSVLRNHWGVDVHCAEFLPARNMLSMMLNVTSYGYLTFVSFDDCFRFVGGFVEYAQRFMEFHQLEFCSFLTTYITFNVDVLNLISDNFPTMTLSEVTKETLKEIDYVLRTAFE